MEKTSGKLEHIKKAIESVSYEVESAMDSCGVEDGVTFGRWKVDLKNKLIFCEETAWDFSYADVETSSDVIYKILHVKKKSWTTDSDLGALLLLFSHIYQGRFSALDHEFFGFQKAPEDITAAIVEPSPPPPQR